MANMDVYQQCPCGSGKKIKFCCLDIIEDVVQAERLRTNNQLRQAEQHLRKILEKHPGRILPLHHLAAALLQEGRVEEARLPIREILEKDPDHPYALVMDVVQVMQTEGVAAAIPRAEAAFARDIPGLHVLAESIGNGFIRMGEWFAGCQYLKLALILCPDEEERADLGTQVYELLSQREIPYLLRINYTLQTPSALPAAESERLLVLAGRGCFLQAAEAYETAAAAHPDDAALWRNAGVCWASAAHKPEAIRNLHRAASIESDFETAVEAEALAQTLEAELPENLVSGVVRSYTVESVSRLIGLLKQHPRISVHAEKNSPENSGTRFYGGTILDREIPTEIATPDAIPRGMAGFVLVPAIPEQNRAAQFNVVVINPGFSEEVFSLIKELGGDLLTRNVEDDSALAKRLLRPKPLDMLNLDLAYHFPDGFPTGRRGRLMKTHWEHIKREVWPNLPLFTLGGKTPLEASKDAALRVPLTAAIIRFDSQCDCAIQHLELQDYRARFHLPEPEQIPVTDDLDVDTLNILQMRRLPLHELSDDQLESVMELAMELKHTNFLYDALTEYAARDGGIDSLSRAQTYDMLAGICQERLNREEALAWINKARELQLNPEYEFEWKLRLDFKELILHLVEEDVAQINALLKKFQTYYIPKIPSLREQLEQILEDSGVTPPWKGATTLWRPESAQAASSGKLWLPGQS